MNSPHQNRIRIHENGTASLIVVMLVSMVMMASTFKVFNTVKNTQEIGTAVNAMSHAETATWSAAEAFRLYLEQIDTSELLSLNDEIPITMDATYGTLSARDVNVIETSPHVFEVKATIVNIHAAAKSSAKLQLVYSVFNDIVAAPSWPTDGVIAIKSNLVIGGNVNLLNNGEPVDIMIDGDLEIQNASVNPINSISSTGTVSIGGSVEVHEIYADDDVTLADTRSNIVRTLGNFKATGSAAIGSVQANGNVLVQASGRFDEISSPKTITINAGGGSQGLVTAGESILAKNTNSLESANAVGKIVIDNWFSVGQAISMDDISCPSVYWTSVDTLSANGSLINCPASSGSVIATEGASNVVTPPEDLTPITLTDPVIDVWTLQDNANYFVQYDSIENRIKVSVRSVNGLLDGTVYTLGQYNGSGAPHIDYLCSKTNPSGKCITPSTPTLPLCVGYSPYNSCISYNGGTNTFSIAPNQTVPGIIFFDGNVELSNGHSITTILASGNIKSSGQFKHWAANFGGYDNVCLGKADHVASSVRSRYTEAYSIHYPLNLCDTDNSIYTPTATGNIGLAAGGVNPDITKNPTGAYTGGDIELGSSTRLVGAVLAGNMLATSGDVNIRGLVATASLGDDTMSTNTIGSSTTIDLSGVGDFDPTNIPDMGTTTTLPAVTRAVVLWSRPL